MLALQAPSRRATQSDVIAPARTLCRIGEENRRMAGLLLHFPSTQQIEGRTIGSGTLTGNRSSGSSLSKRWGGPLLAYKLLTLDLMGLFLSALGVTMIERVSGSAVSTLPPCFCGQGYHSTFSSSGGGEKIVPPSGACFGLVKGPSSLSAMEGGAGQKRQQSIGEGSRVIPHGGL